MEKDILIQNLRTRVGDDDASVISDKTFEGIADSVLSLFADDEKITEDTWKLPVATLKQFAGQKRFDEKNFTEKYKTEYATKHEKSVEERIKAATAKALEDYKKEHPETKTDPVQEGEKKEAPKTEDIVKAVLESLNSEEGAIGKLSKQFSDYVTNQSEREKAALKSRVKAQLKQHLTDLKANNEACVDDALDDLEYGDTPSYDSLKQKAVDAYEKRYKRYYADGGKPFGGKTSGGDPETGTAFVKDKLAKLKQEAEDSAAYSKQMGDSFM